MSNLISPIKRVCEISIGAFALATLLAVLSACTPFSEAGANSTPTVIPTLSPLTTLAPLPPTAAPASATSSGACGAWAGANGSTGQPVADKYGAISNCELAGDSWVIATEGIRDQPGVIGVDTCHGVAACLNGQSDRSITAWTFYPGPNAGGIRILGVQSPGVLIIDDGGRQMDFTIATGTYH